MSQPQLFRRESYNPNDYKKYFFKNNVESKGKNLFLSQVASNNLQNSQKLPNRKKDFNQLIGVRITRRDYEQFRNMNYVSPQVIAFAANYFQAIDQEKEAGSKNLFFALVYIDFTKKDEFQYYMENLLEKQFNPQTCIYLVVFIHREEKIGKRKKLIWQMVIFRIPDKICCVFTNQMENNQEEDEQWYQITRVIDGVFHIDFYKFKHFYNIKYKNYSSMSDGALELMWFLYKWLGGVEIERVEKIEYDREQFHLTMLWLMLKLKFLQEETQIEEEPLPEYPIDYKQKLRHFNDDKNIRQKKTFKDVGIQTEFSVHPYLNFDFGRFSSNKVVYLKKDKADKEVQTFGIGFQFNQQVEYTKIPRVFKSVSRQIYIPNSLENFQKQELEKAKMLRQKQKPQKQMVFTTKQLTDEQKIQEEIKLKREQEQQELNKNKQKLEVRKIEPTNFSLNKYVNPIYQYGESYSSGDQFQRKVQLNKVPTVGNMQNYVKYLFLAEKDLGQGESNVQKKQQQDHYLSKQEYLDFQAQYPEKTKIQFYQGIYKNQDTEEQQRDKNYDNWEQQQHQQSQQTKYSYNFSKNQSQKNFDFTKYY
ncbi:hypothetical protein PPERSA_08370 [Pseudocohnilembus persalinus]|uniref:Uncharacterized protein n=1 Tax=Pseudocohnilembus persalinus TaxID=266149 RepID=A0A0V0R643_PSEPJ|nr:hypothetical protein PPERSA_08370 [Pseudocohnilembus persalinus]|eukprot:KRX09969.1 hypothetical protein PPERSA_08370 [Pseudocohnilembus persalinus]